MYKTSKRPKTLGKMLFISPLKLAIAQGKTTMGLSQEKIQKIKAQVKKRFKQLEIIKKYQPFTSNMPKRRPRQVGAGTSKD